MVDILRPNYGQVWASEGEKVSPVEDKMKLGWVQEMMPFQWENYLQGRQDDAILYLLQKGIAEYSPSQEYVAQKSVVVYQGAVYIALETVTGVLPSVSSSWKRLSTISDASGVVSIAGGGTGASTAAAARANLGLGSAALLAADSVVQKDTSGNFTAGVITASLAGNAATADKLKTARTVQITGAVTSTATPFDGSSNLVVPVTAIDASALTQGSVPASALGNSVTKTSATGAAILPVGSTADRPISPAFGHFRGNTTSGILEYYNGAEWVTSTAQSLSYVLNRGNHTGTQPMSSVADLIPTLASKPNIADGAQFLSLNNEEAPAAGRLQVFQKYSDPVMMPDDQWWSLLRMQHGGYPEGYWQDFAMPFSGAAPMYRSNNMGVKTPWKTVANTDDVSHVANTTISALSLKADVSYVNDAFVAADNALAVGFASSSETPYIRRKSDNALYPLATTQNIGKQQFNGSLGALQYEYDNTINATGLKSIGSAPDGAYRYSNPINCSSLDGHVMSAYLAPGVESFWQFGVGGVTFRMGNTGVGSSSGGWIATSDNRVKKELLLIENALDKVDQLTGYTYLREDMRAMDGTAPRRAGLIAQDVLKVLPETLHIPANYDAESNEGDLLGLSQDGITGLLVNAIKELRQEVNDLRKELEALKQA